MVITGVSIDKDCKAFLDKIQEVNPTVPTELVERAFRFSYEAHHNQLRKSGEPYLAHPVAVALVLAEQKLDAVTISAGLLHDVLEDTAITIEEMAQQFGEEVALLVDGVTKINSFQIQSVHERQAETYRKMLLSMAKDVRVIIIKFADRLHNLRTLKYLKPDRVEAIARETLDIYAPLAHRLGMARIKWDLEDLAFKHLHPDKYKQIVAKVVATHHDRETLIESFAAPLRRRLKEEDIQAAIIGRPKHFYSIYQKMVRQNKTFEEIYDLLAIRVIVNSVRECYHVLGIIHSLWTPIQDRFKDFISMPKTNGYQSLHTTVFGERGHIIEAQIRTWEMHQVAEDGIAAHWLYKDGSERSINKDDKALTWLKNLIEWQKDLTDSSEFYEFFKIDLYDAEIFVFTPKGDLISLPKGATVLDFAFSVHTHLGLHCIGAKVDGKFCPINTKLKSGSTVEILHSSSKTPSVDWLREVKTPKARSAIRRWLKNTGRQESIELGKKILSSCYRKLHLATPLSDHLPLLLQHLGINSLDQLHEHIGNGEVPVSRIIAYFTEAQKKRPLAATVVSKLVDTLSGADKTGVLVGGNDNIMVRFAQCCSPIPGDPIVGFVTRGRGISVHRTDCPNARLFAQDTERCIAVSWDKREKNRYIVFLDIQAQDRPGLLHDITGVFINFGVNVLDGNIKTVHGHVHNVFKVQIQNRNQLKQIFGRIQKIHGIEKISRMRNAMALMDESS